jgi:hypothetical protein
MEPAAQAPGKGRGHMGKKLIRWKRRLAGFHGAALIAAVTVCCGALGAPAGAQTQDERAVLARGEVTGTLPSAAIPHHKADDFDLQPAG